jgi:single-stranded DNA-binding protein
MGQEKGDFKKCRTYSVTLVGFVGSDPEQRQTKGNGSKFTVLWVATQRSWKNADDEWSSKTDWHRVVVIWNLTGKREELATGQLLTRNAY